MGHAGDSLPAHPVGLPSPSSVSTLFCSTAGGKRRSGFKRLAKRLGGLELLSSEQNKQRNNLNKPEKGCHIEECEQSSLFWAKNRKCVIKTTYFTVTTEHRK